jgi:hypothetical protein
MKVDLERKLKDPKGVEFSDGATIAMAAYNALQAPLPSDQGAAVDVALKRYRLLQTIGAGGVQELTSEDITEIKKRAAAALSLIAFGSLADALEQRPEAVPIGDAKAQTAA